ncbi:aminopeptidase P family protein [Roseovarius faecimaris]|uniref:Aminopeptidase P family protein n=1 Tax=Roseovarius faecimaris TaxID=2494550 RepID=A0A6I6IZA6_9RHOB|nr:aminopeptidase P family protein [Roseovarius faecimaris]QGX97958.1 aminopeptidase P family protein [Roseovarius faecimaris]
MFQSFADTASPDQGPPRLARLREVLAQSGLAGYLIPRADAHQGEYVAPRDDRLAWLTGFTGSAGFCIALMGRAGVFVDGRYRVQVKVQVDTAAFTPVDWPETKPADWLREALPNGGVIGFDPWLYSPEQIEAIETGLKGSGVSLQPTDNPIDSIWPDQPAPPQGKITPYPSELAGKTHQEKREALARTLRDAGQECAVITLPDSIAWLLNIRGADIPRNPLPHGFAILHDTGQLTLFVDPAKLDDTVRAHLGAQITLRPPNAFGPALHSLTGPVRLDKATVPIWVRQQLDEAGVPHVWGQDPCILPKARKTGAEIAATRRAHLRDGAALCEFLTWFDAQPPGTITEIDVVRHLEECRAATGELLDISFDTIAGSGPHGALAHYRVTTSSNRTLQAGELLVLDGGGQYIDGTTDITRTLPIGEIGEDERAAFTRVLQGMIAMSRVRWPAGLAGRDLDVLARYPLWLADQDYNHGTGHGVGVHLCVHEGPQRLSRISDVPLEPGMILSNEPGYYREGAFGIRIENLVVVQEAAPLPQGDQTGKLCFETISFVPIDRRLIIAERLSEEERAWLNDYHAECRTRIAPQLSDVARTWLETATAPL